MPERRVSASATTIDVRSQLTQAYTVASPVGVDGSLVAAPPGDGPPTLLTVGTDGQVFTVRPDPESDGEWRQQPIPGFRAKHLAAVRDADGDLVLVAVSPNSESIDWVREHKGTWSAPQGAFTTEATYSGVTAVSHGAHVWVAATVGAEAPYNVMVATLTTGEGAYDGFLTVRAAEPLIAFGSEAGGQPGLYLFQQPQLYVEPDTTFGRTDVFDDHGSGAHMDVSFWKPETTTGERFGDYAQGDYGPPHGPVAGLRAVAEDPAQPLLAKPTGVTEVWSSHHSGERPRGSLWRLEAPEGYVALGDVAQAGFDAPALGAYRVVRGDLVASARAFVPRDSAHHHGHGHPEGSNANLIWANWGKHGGKRCAVDRITPAGAGHATGLFHAHADWKRPTATVHCLAANLATRTVVLFAPLPTGGSDDLEVRRIVGPGPGTLADFAAVEGGDGSRFVGLFGDDLFTLEGGSWSPLGGVGFRDAALAAASDGGLDLFAVGRSDHRLYHSRWQDGAWGPWVEIAGDHTFVHVTATTDASGQPLCFAVTSTLDLLRVDQDPRSTDWQVHAVEQETGTGVVELEAWAARLRFTGPAGPVVSQRVELTTDAPALAEVAGRAVFVDADTPVVTTTGIAGMMTFQVETGTLSAPTLRLSVAGDSTVHSVALNGEVQAQLRDLTGADLLGAPRSPLRGTDWDNAQAADKVAAVVREAMALGAQLPAGTPDQDTFPGAGSAARWQVSFASGVPELRHLSAAEMVAVRERHAAMRLEGRGWLSFHAAWGDVWEAIEEGAAELWEITVDTVESGVDEIVSSIEATLEFIIDGAHYVYSQAVALIDQVFDIVAGVFEKIGAGFDELFEWLGTIFSWPDIRRTHTVLRHALCTLLEYLPQAVEQERSALDQEIADATAKLVERIQGLVESPPTTLTSSTASLGAQGRQESGPVGRAGTDHNPLLTGILHHLPGAEPAAHRPRSDDDPLAGLEAQLNAIGEQLRQAPGMHTLVDRLKDYGDDPGSLAEAPLTVLAELLADIAAALVGTAGTGLECLVDLVLEAVAWLADQVTATLTDGWKVPILVPLYNYLAGTDGDSVSILDLLSLAAAVPATAAYRILEGGEAPYPDDAAVTAFQDAFTVEWLLGRSASASPAQTEPADRSVASEEWLRIAEKVLGSAYAAGLGLRGFVEIAPFAVLFDGQTVPKPLAATVEGLRFLTGCAAAPLLEGEVDRLIFSRWLGPLAVGPMLGSLLVSQNLGPGTSLAATLAGALHLGLSIPIYVQHPDHAHAVDLAEAVVADISTGVLRILVWPGITEAPYIGQAYMVLLALLAALNFAGSETAAVLRFVRLYAT